MMSWNPNSRLSSISFSLGCRGPSPHACRLTPHAVLYVFPQPLPEFVQNSAAALELPRGLLLVLRAVEHEPHTRGVHGAVHHVHEAADVLGRSAPDGQPEGPLRGLLQAFHERGAAGEHDARGAHVLVAGLLETLLHHAEELVHAGLDD